MSKLFILSGSDFAKAIVMAVISGAVLPIAAIIQTPGFNIVQANWHQLAILALNGAIVGGVSYLAKNFLSDSEGRVLGRIG